MSGYVVSARRWARGWELHIVDPAGAEVGVTQSRTLAGAEAMVRDYLSVDLDQPGKSFEVEVRPDLDADLIASVTAARASAREAERAQREAAARSRAVAHALRDAGLSGSEIAVVLRVSTQRVSQLMSSRR